MNENENVSKELADRILSLLTEVAKEHAELIRRVDLLEASVSRLFAALPKPAPPEMSEDGGYVVPDYLAQQIKSCFNGFEVVVGVDTDGTIKSIDQINYAPKGGWEILPESADVTLKPIDLAPVDNCEIAEMQPPTEGDAMEKFFFGK